MCDYSLELQRSRPAAKDETLTLHRFSSGTMGFVGNQVMPAGTNNTIKAMTDIDCAVCVQPGTVLRLEGIAEAVQHTFKVGPTEQVTMIRMEGGTHSHHDAVRFANGREALLQSLNVGITCTLMAPDYTDQVTKIADSLADTPVNAAPAPREPALV